MKSWDYSSKKNERVKLREMKRTLRKLVHSRKKNSVKARLLYYLIGGKDLKITNLLSETINDSKTKDGKTKDDMGQVIDESVRQRLNRSNFEMEEMDSSSPVAKLAAKNNEKKKNPFKNIKMPPPVITSFKMPSK